CGSGSSLNTPAECWSRTELKARIEVKKQCVWPRRRFLLSANCAGFLHNTGRPAGRTRAGRVTFGSHSLANLSHNPDPEKHIKAHNGDYKHRPEMRQP